MHTPLGPKLLHHPRRPPPPTHIENNHTGRPPRRLIQKISHRQRIHVIAGGGNIQHPDRRGHFADEIRIVEVDLDEAGVQRIGDEARARGGGEGGPAETGVVRDGGGELRGAGVFAGVGVEHGCDPETGCEDFVGAGHELGAVELLDAGGDAGGLRAGDGAVDDGEGGQEGTAEGSGGVTFDGGVEDRFGLVEEDVADGVELACSWEGGGGEVGSLRIELSDSGECVVGCAGCGGEVTSGGDADQ